jgi:hypothetical protein
MLVRTSFEAAGGFTDVATEDRSPADDTAPLFVVWARTKVPDDYH